MIKRRLCAGMLLAGLLLGCGPETLSPIAPDPIATDGALVVAPSPTDDPTEPDESADEPEAPAADDESPIEAPTPVPTASPAPSPSPSPLVSPSPAASGLPDLQLGDVDLQTPTAEPPKKSLFGKLADGVKGLIQKVKDRLKRK